MSFEAKAPSISSRMTMLAIYPPKWVLDYAPRIDCATCPECGDQDAGGLFNDEEQAQEFL